MLREKLTRRFWRDLFKGSAPVDAAAGDANLFALGRRLRLGQHVFHDAGRVSGTRRPPASGQRTPASRERSG
jgi:hypothetical protein